MSVVLFSTIFYAAIAFAEPAATGTATPVNSPASATASTQEPAATAPEPSGGPGTFTAGSQQPLREIGRVRATTPLCRTLLADAVRAVEIETDNDQKLGIAEATLGRVDLDSSPVAKSKGVHEISRQFVALRAGAVSGSALMAHFREQAKTAPNDDQRKDLIAFAEALDGALHRQKVLADDMGRLVAYLDAHEPVSAEEHDRAIFQVLLRENDARYPRTAFDAREFGPLAAVADTLSTTAKNASTELAHRAEPIAGDEAAAADRIEPAFSKC